MRIFYSKFFFFNALLLFSVQRTSACGYDWVGDCSSAVHLRINGTLDSFDIADCPAGIRFNALHLGTLQTLSLANAKTITWESCINNVSAVNLKYRVYEQGGGGGNFQSLSLGQDYFTILGPYTTRYRSQATNIDLAAGLTVGKIYVLEVYFVADIDTIGDDFVPETTMLKNNGGQNYRLSFTYGGPTATPFVVIATNVKEPNCHGESNGTIGVSVWGDQTGLFYNWSNVNLNFFQQNGLPTGTYTVTVTGANYAESDTIVLGQPELLSAQFSSIQPVACGGGVGSATILPSGGTIPYQYSWQNGQTSATATFLNSGTYTVSVIDANHCNLMKSVAIPGTGLVQQSSSASICTGESILVGNTWIDEAGVYNILIPGNAGCDTMLSLTVNEINPASLLANMPSNILVTCNTPATNLCAETAPNAFFQWSKDGIPATQTPCLLANAGGVYTIKVTLDGCLASKNILSEEHLVPLPAHFVGLDTLTCNGLGNTPTLLRAVTNAENPTFYWTNNGQFLTSTDSCWFVISNGGFSFPELLVTDVFGCTTQAVNMVTIIEEVSSPSFLLNTTDASGPNIPDGSAFVQISGTGSFEIIWSTGQIEQGIQNLPPGTYCVTVTGENGCSRADCNEVGYTLGLKEKLVAPIRIFPNPACLGDWLEIELPDFFSGASVWLELIDDQGKSIKTENLENTLSSIRFQLPNTLKQGLFFLQIFSEYDHATGKILLNE